jgi:F-type H+-transporting ATPase subunit gamma
MANLKDIRRKIKSVKNTQKTTRAMKLVSTAKLRKSEELAKKARVYSIKLNEVLSEIAHKVNQYKVGGSTNKFFERIEEPKIVDILFVTADKGLCGGFNVQTIKKVKNLMEEYKSKKIKVRLRAVGRKGVDYFRFNDIDLLQTHIGVSAAPTYEKASEIIKGVVDDFINGATDGVVIVHNGYLNMISQEMKVLDFLPVDISKVDTVDSPTSMMEVEPEDDETILDELLKKYFDFNMYFSLIDSLAAEHSARMQAMDSATNNAKERVNQLTIEYNKARQESITTELTEIISGMESMK